MKFFSWVRAWYRRWFGVSYQHLVVVRIFRQRLIDNYQALVRHAGVPVAPVLKSNAYGHGLLSIARILESLRPPYFVVDSYYEMMRLRQDGLRTPILIVGHTFPENIAANKFRDVVFTILSVDELRVLVEVVKKPTRVHLKIDTGLYRHGVMAHEFEEVARLIAGNPFLHLMGLCTHYRDADCDENFTREQTARFREAISFFGGRFPSCTEFHSENSAGLVGHAFEGHTFARSGLALYGLGSDLVKPVMSVYTRIISVKKIPAGVAVGYGGTFISPREMVIATIPFGYYEGLDRRLSNKGFVSVCGVLCPVVGRISMNISTIDVSSVPDVALHDEVEVVSADPLAPHSIASQARVSGDIAYTHLVHMLEHAQRDIV